MVEIVTAGERQVIAPEGLLPLMRRGVRAFPTRADKRPCFTGWQDSATADLSTLVAQVEEAAGRYGGLGLLTGEVVSVLDLDGPAAFDAMVDLAAEADDRFPRPEQLVGRTPRGGWHVYYRSPADPDADRNNVRLHDLPVDWRGRGGLVQAFGERRSLQGRLIPAEPAWLVQWRADASPRGRSAGYIERQLASAGRPMTASRYDALLRRIATTPEDSHKRNSMLWWGARVTWGCWLTTRPSSRPSEESVRADLEEAGHACGLDVSEVGRTVESAMAQARRDVFRAGPDREAS
ncbi:bifunctional DNA primase/polymerase [Agromyces allii]|uniref:DNA primase/polymerase bifunctional N-terminal domain-containing protein n=1 Tax=Agromyces allii TaxID=393607 RepID=A0ABN2Q2D1_9MICO|nr:bifunctional DNA primase/polymerase [Agromyces allii]